MMMGLDLILLAVFGGAIAKALGWQPQFNPTKPAESSQKPVEIVRERYASGEITREEYDQIRRDLED